MAAFSFYNVVVPLQTSKISAEKFKALISTVLKFPPSAVVSASEVIHFAVNMGRARVSVAGLVTGAAAVLATGETDAFTVDYRVLGSYAALCPVDGTVQLEVSRKEKEVRFTCGEHKLKVAFNFGSVIKKPQPGPTEILVVSDHFAKTIKWLASVAEKDEAKPDMCCVYLRNGSAMAGNQKCIAVATLDGIADVECALPLNLCAVLEAGDKITKAVDGFIVVSGCGAFAVPFHAASIKFPYQVVERLTSSDSHVFATCAASALSGALKESIDCVARVPKADAVVRADFADGKMSIRAMTGTAHYSTMVDADVKKTGGILVPLVEAGAAVSVFDGSEVAIKHVLPKRETSIDGGTAKVFFAPVAKK